MKNGVYDKAMENVRNMIYVRLVSNEKDYLKCTSKSSYMSQKVTLTSNKPAYVGICILDWTKILTYE